MSWFYYIYVLLVPCSAALSFWAIRFIWGRREAWAARSFLALVVCCAAWIVTELLGMLSGSRTAAEFWMARLQVTPISLVPVLLLLFVLDYTGQRRRLGGVRWAGLFLVPAVTHLLNYTSLFPYYVSDVELLRIGPLWFMKSWTPGPWFSVHLWYSYLLICVSLFILLSYVLRSVQYFRGRVLMVFLGAAVPFAASVATNFGPRLALDWTAVSFGFTLTIWATTLFRDRSFLGIMPIALDAVLERMDEGVIILDERRCILELNPAAARMLNATRPELLGWPLDEVIRIEPTRGDGDAANAGRREEVSINGRYFDLSDSILCEPSGQAVGHLLVLHDVTEHRRLIKDLDAYARIVAHDLKSPLTAIVGYLDLVGAAKAERLDGELRGFVDGAVRMCEKMTTIINELLLLASVRKMDEMQTGPLDMAAVVAAAQKRLSGAIAKSGAEIAAGGPWPTAHGHAPWVEEVWANYLSNAIKYGGSPPRITLGASPDGPHMVRFWVRDNGSGLAEPERERLFREFSRLHPARGDSHGLGLSIVKRIVEKLGGTVGVDSAPGAGSTFWFTLPAAGDASEKPSPAA